MNLATSLFRRNVAAASLVAGSVLLANAGPAQAASIEPQCKSAGDIRAQIRCSLNVVKRDNANLDSASCYNGVTRDIMEAKKVGPLSADQKSVFGARIAKCG